MEDEDKPEMTFMYFTGPDGKTFELNVKQDPIKWPEQKKEETEPKRFTKTLTFKLDKKMCRRINKYLERAGFKNKKEYLRFKKWHKRTKKEMLKISKMKTISYPKLKKRWAKVFGMNRRMEGLHNVLIVTK